MRASARLVPLLLCIACQQEADHPGAAPACDPTQARCVFTPPASGSSSGNQGGATSGSDEEVANFSGTVRAFDDDYFDRGSLFSRTATVTATGESGARVKGIYDGASFGLQNVLKDANNWFLVEPELASGMMATLLPIDTRATKADQISLGVANAALVDAIFQASSGKERSLERAQIALTLVDESLRSVPGVTGTLTTELTTYRAAGGWIGEDVTDSSGMIFFGNVPAGTALTRATIGLSGSVTARVEVTITAGAITVVNAIVNP